MRAFRFLIVLVPALSVVVSPAYGGPNDDLKQALMKCNLEGTQQALAAGATLDSLTTPDLNAVSYTYFCPNVTQFLIDSGVDVKHPGGTYALAAAGNNYSKEVVEILIKAGADPNAISPIYKTTPVEVTIRQSNCAPCLKAMADGGADFKKLGTNNANYVQILSAFSQTAESRKDLFAKGKAGMESYGLFVPDWYGNLGPDRNGTPDDMLAVLAAGGADVNSKNSLGQTPLYAALNLQKLGLAKVLVKAGADVKLQSTMGAQTPDNFATAAVFGDAELLGLMADAGADINIKVAAASLPAQARLASAKGSVLVAADDLTPLVIALNNGNIDGAKFLIERGADVGVPVSGYIYTPVASSALSSENAKRKGAYCPSKIEGKTAIYWAAEQGNVDLIRAIGDKMGWKLDAKFVQKQKSISVDFDAFSGDVLECRDLKNELLPSEYAAYFGHGEAEALLKSKGM